MTNESVRDYLNDMSNGALLFDGLDDCLIGIAACQDGNEGDCAVYSKLKMIKHFMKSDMDYDEAVEHVEFNVECIRVSDAKNPIIVDDLGF